jgi:hypothetical protein
MGEVKEKSKVLKVIYVDACIHCPYCKWDYYHEHHYCEKAMKNIANVVVSTKKIPKFCPLEDYKEAK